MKKLFFAALLMVFVISLLTNCAGALLVGEVGLLETAIATGGRTVLISSARSAVIRAAASRAVTGRVVTGGIMTSRAATATVAAGTHIVLSHNGSRRILSKVENDTEKPMVEILSKRSVRLIESNQIITFPGDIYIVKAEYLNVRSGPGTEHPSIAVLQKGRPVAVGRKQNGWFETWVEDEIKGWVKDKFVEELESMIIRTEREDQNVTFSNQDIQLIKSRSDRDSDQIPDEFDDCPGQHGKKEMHGCPDNDSDGVSNKNDKCPNDFGLLRFNGCPDKDNDGVPDNEDRCPNQIGIPANQGCPIVTYVYAKDSDGDGVFDDKDYCPTQYARTANGCPYSVEDIEPDRKRPIQVGLGISGGFLISSSDGLGSDAASGGIGFSPFIFTAIRLSNRSRLQLDLSYSKKRFILSSPAHFIENAELGFQDVRAYAKVNIHSIFLGGYYGKTLKVSQKETPYSERNFLDKSDYVTIGEERPVNEYNYGLCFGYEQLFRGGFLFGLGYEHSLSGYFNKKYWDNAATYYEVDNYISENPEVSIGYLYATMGYRF